MSACPGGRRAGLQERSAGSPPGSHSRGECTRLPTPPLALVTTPPALAILRVPRAPCLLRRVFARSRGRCGGASRHTELAWPGERWPARSPLKPASPLSNNRPHPAALALGWGQAGPLRPVQVGGWEAMAAGLCGHRISLECHAVRRRHHRVQLVDPGGKAYRQPPVTPDSPVGPGGSATRGSGRHECSSLSSAAPFS